MNEIIPGLYLGNQCNAMDTNTLKDHNVTHILTINVAPLDSIYVEDFKYKFIHAQDCLESDILTKFKECIDFIDDALNIKGAVFVHCVVGVSRSATITIAYLMNKRNLSFNDAFDFVKSKRSIICPNPNFRNQLEIFEDMGSRLNEDFMPYKRYRLYHCAQKCQSFDQTKSLKDILQDEYILKNTSTLNNSAKVVYKCRKCRKPLFTNEHLIPHLMKTPNQQSLDEAILGVGPEFDIENKDSLKQDGDTNKFCEENQLFVEPLDWMKDDIYQIEGKLSCPKCGCKIGSFTWVGEPCVCDAWICPAFHIGSQRVDKSIVKRSSNLPT